MTMTSIDVDDELLAAVTAELGTTTKRETINAALRLVMEQRERARQMTAPLAPGESWKDRLGLGEDIDDPAVMREARR